MPTARGSGASKGLVDDYEAQLDAHFQSMVSDADFCVPGVVVHLRRGSDIYTKSFGFADKQSGRAMEQDAMIRMWSMTKVLCCATALRLYERGLFKLDDPVSDYIDSFQREWEIVKPSEAGSQSVDYYAFVKGETMQLRYNTMPATKPMLIKHLMSETSGIEYDQFSDYDDFNDGALGCGWGGGVASALRRQQNPDVYRSTNILGADCTLAEFCDHIAVRPGIRKRHGVY
jgi:CubicO group peptidase (beta-lactamase class C family)